MTYIDEIFGRVNMQQIRQFLLHGLQCDEVTPKTYKQRIDAMEQSISDMVKRRYSDEEEREEVLEEIHGFVSVMEDVYMEIGMQCGSILTAQLMRLGQDVTTEK